MKYNMNNKLYFLSKFLNRNENLLVTFMVIFIVGANLCMLTERYLLGSSTYILIAIFSLFRESISHRELDKGEVNIPTNGENIIIKKTFFYDGTFRKFINTTDPSRKRHFYTIKEGQEWTIFSIVEDKDDWVLFIKDDHIQVHIGYFESRNYWETKSDKRANLLKELGI